MAVQVLGLCRFSVPSRGAFQVTHDSIEARRAMLYDPVRLNRRFAWFENVLLPCIHGQTDEDFVLVVVVGEDFPEAPLRRMQALVAEVPQIRLEFAPPAEHRDICAEAMRPHLDRNADLVAQFRLDDDDGVAHGFVQRIRRDIRQLSALIKRNRFFALDYAKGFVLRDAPEGLGIEQVLAQCWAPGLVIVSEPREGKFVLDFPHHKVWRRMPVLSQIDQVMFLRGAHDQNDSDVGSKTPISEQDRPEVEALIADRFGVDVAHLGLALAAARPRT